MTRQLLPCENSKCTELIFYVIENGKTAHSLFQRQGYEDESFIRLLAILGGFCLLLAIFWGVARGFGAYVRHELTPSSHAYVDDSIRAILTTWSEDELVKRASPEMRANATQGQLNQFFTTLEKLGKFHTYDGANGEVEVTYYGNRGLIITAPYLAKASFQNGPAQIRIKLIRHGDAWYILDFHVDMPNMP